MFNHSEPHVGEIINSNSNTFGTGWPGVISNLKIRRKFVMSNQTFRSSLMITLNCSCGCAERSFE